MTCKLTYFFRDIVSSTDSGFSENFYIGSGDSQTALAAATAPGWLNERLAFLASSYMLTSIRAQNVTNRFDNARKRFNMATGVGQFAVGGRNQPVGEPSWEGVLLRLFGGTVTTRIATIRGIPDNVVGENLEYQPSAAFQRAFDQWRDDLTVNPQAYQLRHQVLGTPLATPTNILVGPDLRTLTMTYPTGTAPGVLAPRSLVKISGVLNAAPVNGIYRVQLNNGTQITLYPKRRNIFGTPLAPTVVQLVTYSYQDITDSDPIRGAERKAGRPFDQLRGRASVRTH